MKSESESESHYKTCPEAIYQGKTWDFLKGINFLQFFILNVLIYLFYFLIPQCI